jgi:hypothetical protein
MGNVNEIGMAALDGACQYELKHGKQNDESR